ncbi:hypothetical protein MW887_002844 [Aspergillus wentii]|nr:hypothetical protein MW887_002844 [Aspergillus wentii]
MASSLRMPAGSLFSTARTNNVVFRFSPANSSAASAVSCQCRHFSQGSQRNGRGIPQNIALKQPAQPNLGLLPGTFIRPLWRDMPSIFQHPRERLQLEWLWLKGGVQNFLGLVVLCKWGNNNVPLELKGRRQIARELHQKMYTAFAGGDVTSLRKICCNGLANKLIQRIENRPKNEKVTWTLDKYILSPATFFTGARIVADRKTQIPDLPDSTVRQVVVRITSKQSTGKSKLPSGRDANTAVEDATPEKQQDCTEYIVIQKLRWAGDEQDWRIWGHATPTTVEDLDSPFFASGLTISERLDAMKETMQGRR